MIFVKRRKMREIWKMHMWCLDQWRVKQDACRPMKQTTLFVAISSEYWSVAALRNVRRVAAFNKLAVVAIFQNTKNLKVTGFMLTKPLSQVWYFGKT